jgi:hypothetical protein
MGVFAMSAVREAIKAIRLAKASLEPELQKFLGGFFRRLREMGEEYRRFKSHTRDFPWWGIERVTWKMWDLVDKAAEQGKIGLVEKTKFKAILSLFKNRWVDRREGYNLAEMMERLKNRLDQLCSQIWSKSSPSGSNVPNAEEVAKVEDEQTRQLLSTILDVLDDYNKVYQEVKQVTGRIRGIEEVPHEDGQGAGYVDIEGNTVKRLAKAGPTLNELGRALLMLNELWAAYDLVRMDLADEAAQAWQQEHPCRE